MPKMIFVNLPVTDVARSVAFYQAIGFTKDEQFSNEQGALMVWTDTIRFMLTSHELYASLVAKPIGDAHAASLGAFALAFDSKAEVDAITQAAVAAGGTEGHPPEDLGFMYSRAFEDPDGYGFGPMWMDVAAATVAMAGQPAGASA